MEDEMKNDVLLLHDIVEKLEQDLGVTPQFVGVEVHHGVVTLAGFVGSEAARDAARRVAQRVDGVLNVILDLEIRPDLIPPRSVPKPVAA
jgi:osmotically-inducible protein OsmY